METNVTLLEGYLFHCNYERRLSQATIKAYRLDLNQFLTYLTGARSIAETGKNVVQDFLRHLFEKKLKETSIRRKMICLKAFFSYLESEKLLVSNPFDKLHIRLKLRRWLPEVMNLEEVKGLIEAAKSDFGSCVHKKFAETDLSQLQSPNQILKFQNVMVLELLFSLAVRVNELCNLNFADIDLVRNSINVLGKGSRERMILIPNEEVRSMISRFITLRLKASEGSTWLFTNRLRRRLTPQSVRSLIKKYRVYAKITKRITPHIFRHTTATMLIENGTDIRIVQSLLGHSSIATTQIYTHVSRSAESHILTMNHPRNRF